MICFVYRLLISNALDGDGPLPLRVRRHVDSCPSCAAHLRASRLVHIRLRNEAVPEHFNGAAALTARVMERIAGPTGKRAAAVPAIRYGSWAAVVAACLLVAVFAGIFGVDGQGDRAPTKDEISAGVTALAEIGKKLVDGEGAGGSGAPSFANVTRPFAVEVDRLTESADSVKGLFLSILPVERIVREAKGS